MATEETKNYIKNSLASGKTKDEIKLTLASTGWQEKDIEEAFASVDEQTTQDQSSLQDIYPDPDQLKDGGTGMVYGPQVDLIVGGMAQGDSYSDIPPIGDQIGSAWGSFKRGFLPALAAMSAATVLSAIPSIVMLSSPNIGAIVLLVMILPIIALSVWAELAIYNIVINENENGWSQFGKSISKFFPFLWIGILVGLITMGGFFLLIVPAFIFSIWFGLSQFVMLKEDVRGFNALFKSKEYVKENFWAIFARVLILVGISIAVSIPVGLITGLTGAAGPYVKAVVTMLFNIPMRAGLSLFGVAYMYEVYKGLRGKKGDVASQATTGKKVGFGAIAVWGLVAPIIFVILMAVTILSMFVRSRSFEDMQNPQQDNNSFYNNSVVK